MVKSQAGLSSFWKNFTVPPESPHYGPGLIAPEPQAAPAAAVNSHQCIKGFSKLRVGDVTVCQGLFLMCFCSIKTFFSALFDSRSVCLSGFSFHSFADFCALTILLILTFIFFQNIFSEIFKVVCPLFAFGQPEYMCSIDSSTSGCLDSTLIMVIVPAAQWSTSTQS